MRTVTGRARAADGVAIGYEATGDGPVLLLVHGVAADRRQWRRLVPVLAPRFTVVAMDRRGRGLSGPLRDDHSLEVECGDVAAVAASLDGPVHVLGHSGGARLALHAAPSIPEVARLVLYEPPPPERFADGVLERLAALEEAGDREGILRTFLLDVAGNDEEDYAFIQGRPVWPLMLDNALSLPAELRAVSRYRFDPAAVAGIAAPTLCLVGGESGPEVREATERIVAALPDARTRILPGQGHGAMFTAPDLLAWEVERFLGRTSA
ncbi:MAG TPA: alpha/beta hydrolase [Acidimicrobiales bacterium]|nr:alpha/beta hydrolase [Acidimicrobiales bacterium]